MNKDKINELEAIRKTIVELLETNERLHDAITNKALARDVKEMNKMTECECSVRNLLVYHLHNVMDELKEAYK